MVRGFRAFATSELKIIDFSDSKSFTIYYFNNSFIIYLTNLKFFIFHLNILFITFYSLFMFSLFFVPKGIFN